MMEDKKTEYEEEKKGFKAHAVVTLFVVSLLAIINLTYFPEYLWFLFPLAGMTIGLSAHYYFGIWNKKSHTIHTA
jgi:hypothetical protein